MTDNYQRLPIVAVRRLTPDAVEVTFDVPDGGSIIDYKPGQHLAVRAMIDGVEYRRTYSVCAGRNGPLRIGIKRVTGGVFSNWANENLRAGETLDVAGAQGRFTLPPGDGRPRHVLMLAAGAGITPILGMTLDALAHEPLTRVTLVYGNRTLAAAMFLGEIEDLKDRYPARFDVIHVLTGPGQAEADLLSGRLSGVKLKALAAQLLDFENVERAFLCGPDSFIKETRNALFDLGMARDKVHHEFFIGRTGGAALAAEQKAPRSAAPAARAEGSIEAVAILDGQRHPFALAPGQRVLEAALEAGIKAPYSCTGGMCSTCRARVVEGSVTMAVNYSLEEWELRRGFVLTCQAVATSTTLAIDYDAM